MTPSEQLQTRIVDRTATIGIVGLGYVGLPLMLRFVEVGYRVLGFDTDPAKVDMLGRGVSYIGYISDETIEGVVRREQFSATADMTRAKEADVLIICVPTPLDRHRQPDLSYVLKTTEAIARRLRPGQIVALESTTYPGTTEEELKPRIERTGLKIGEDVFLVYSPEREDPANPHYKTQTIPKVCGGTTPACAEMGELLYRQVVDRVVPVSSTRAAEMTKLLENIHRAVNIGLVNEMKVVADRMGIDIYEVIDAAATKPFGFVPYYPGPGLGGHCIPIDPFYLTWKAREYGLNTRFIELAGEVNSSMPYWVIQKLTDGLNAQGRPVKGSHIMMLGIAYKKNVDDTRESPAAEMMDLLRREGARLSYSDPHVPVFPKKRRYRFDLEHVPLTADSLSRQDCVVIATDHDVVDYELVLAHAPLIVDTRGVYRDRTEPHVIRA